MRNIINIMQVLINHQAVSTSGFLQLKSDFIPIQALSQPLSEVEKHRVLDDMLVQQVNE